MNAPAPDGPRLRWTADPSTPAHLLDALGPADVYALYQPIVRMLDGRLFAHEALGRCRWPRFSHVPDLIQTAVDAGRMGRLGRLLREAAAAGAPEHAPLFFNVHASELASRWLVRPDDPMLLRGAPVFVEITETAAIEHFDVAERVLGELARRADLRVVVDDLGAGHSDLNRVRQLRPAVIKLDRSVVAAMQEDGPRRFVEEALKVAQSIRAIVVAEGIETAQEAALSRVLGIELGQGYYFGRPAPLSSSAPGVVDAGAGTESHTNTTVSPSSRVATRNGSLGSSS